MIRFSEFLLESIKPIQTPFGINDKVDDGKYLEKGGYGKGTFFTYFKHESLFYIVSIDSSNELIFFSSDRIITDFSNYDTALTSKQQPFQVLGRVVYVALRLAELLDRTEINFIGNRTLYNTMAKNEYFLDSVKTLGWILDRNDEDSVTFRKHKQK